MENGYQNIYRLPRAAAGITQERAAELLGVSVKSLSNYETGVTIPPNDVVERMVTVYNAQHLAYEHLRATNALMGRVVPELEERSLLETAVRIYNRLNRLEKKGGVDRLMEIAEDDQITQEERQEFDAIMSELRQIVQGGLELEVFCSTGKEEG